MVKKRATGYVKWTSRIIKKMVQQQTPGKNK